MGSENNNVSKPRYDISMSKRTRKPLNFESLQECSAEEENEYVEAVDEEEKKKIITSTVCEEDDGEENESKKCLKKLIEQGRSSLGQHFTKEENQLQLVVKRSEEDDGMKLKKMVSRYAKVVSHMIKLKRNTHVGYRKKQVLTLTK